MSITVSGHSLYLFQEILTCDTGSNSYHDLLKYKHTAEKAMALLQIHYTDFKNNNNDNTNLNNKSPKNVPYTSIPISEATQQTQTSI